MDVSFSRYVKDLGRLSAEERSSLFNRSERPGGDKTELIVMLKEFMAASEELNVDYKGKPKRKNKIQCSKKAIAREVIKKM